MAFPPMGLTETVSPYKMISISLQRFMSIPSNFFCRRVLQVETQGDGLVTRCIKSIFHCIFRAKTKNLLTCILLSK